MHFTIGLSRSDGAVPGGIRWVLKTPYNHVFIYLPHNNTIIEADFKGVRQINKDNWVLDNEVVEEHSIFVKDKDWPRVSEVLHEFIGTEYGYWQIVKILFNYKFKKENGEAKLICSELAARVMDAITDLGIEVFDGITPRDIKYLCIGFNAGYYYGKLP